MLKRMSIRKITVTTLVLFALLLIYFMPTSDKTDYTLSSNSEGMNLYTHGSHKIKAQLSLVVNKARGAKTELIEKEIGLLVEDKPLIWIND